MKFLLYVIEAENRMVKLGRSEFPARRLAAVATHSPVRVRLVAQYDGSVDAERELHERFREFRSHREWFALVGPVADFVNSVRGVGVDRIPDWPELDYASHAISRSRQNERQSEAIRAYWADPVWAAKQRVVLREARLRRMNGGTQ